EGASDASRIAQGVGEEGMQQTEQSRGGLAGEYEVNLMAVGTIESDVELAESRPRRVVFPARPMDLRDAFHGNDQLHLHGTGSGGRPMPSARTPTAPASSPRLGLWATVARPASASD